MVMPFTNPFVWGAALHYGPKALQSTYARRTAQSGAGAAGGAWESIGDTRPGAWLQNQYDRATRGNAYYSGPSDPNQWFSGELNPVTKSLYDRDKQAFFRQAMMSGGADPYGPFGSYLMSKLGPDELLTLGQIFTRAGGPGGSKDDIGALWGTAQAATQFLSGEGGDLQFDYDTIGEALSGALAGNDSIFSKRLQEASANPQLQFTMIRSAIHALGTGNLAQGMRGDLMDQQLERIYYNYLAAQGNGSIDKDMAFHEYLVSVSDEFLDYYWSKERWTAMSRPNAVANSGVNSASTGSGAGGGTF